jgi:hypothetical protein
MIRPTTHNDLAQSADARPRTQETIMRPALRIPPATLIAAVVLVATSCGGSESDDAQATTTAGETVPAEQAEPLDETFTTDAIDTAPASTTAPVASEPPAESTPEVPATDDDAPIELPAVVPLDIDGAQPVPAFPVDLATPAVPVEPGTTYVTTRLGTEIGFQVQSPLTAGQHEVGVIGMDEGDVVVFITQPLNVGGAPETSRPGQLDVNALLDERIADERITVADDSPFEVDGRAGRRLRIESGTMQVDGITVGPGFSVWVIDLDDFTPILVITESDDDAWLAEIDALAQNLRIGTPTTNPLVYTDEPWLFGRSGPAPAGPTRANVLGGIEVDLPENRGIETGSDGITVVLDGAGISKPTVSIEVPGDLLQPDALWPGFVRLGAVESVQQIIDSLAPFVSLTPIDSTVELLGSSATAFDYRRETDDPELEMYTVRPTEWRGESSREMFPASEGRIWLADTEDGPLVVITAAEIDAGTDLADSIAAAEPMIRSMKPISLG